MIDYIDGLHQGIDLQPPGGRTMTPEAFYERIAYPRA